MRGQPAASPLSAVAYLTDVLGRIGSHPNDRLDELLPQHWKPPEQPAAASDA